MLPWEAGRLGGMGQDMQEGQCLLMDLLGLGRDVHAGLGSGHCSPADTSKWSGGGPASELLGEKPPLPFDLEPRVPHGGCISCSGYLGQQAFPPSLSPSSSCPNPLGPEASQSDLGCSSCVLRSWTRRIPWG